MKFAKIAIVLAFLSPLSAAANVSKWVTSEEKGARQYVVESAEGSALNFTCDMGYKNGSPDAAGERVLFLEGPNDEYDSNENVITLVVGDDQYTISSTGSTVADSNWYGFWSDTPDALSKTVDAYVDGKKIASFTMRKAAELYKSSPEDGCLKRSK
uniref:Uncharacterized protein n=1 Tax=feces metagenome TaxID=1861841 RepID=A0A7M2QMZ3_9ZZZZ